MRELETAERACLEAGKIAMKYFQGDFQIRKKGKIDLVTDADVECEKKIKQIILNEYPNHSFMGEEGGTQGESENVWIVDPIDGTTNFSHGLDFFSHSIALVKGKEIVCGAVYNPVNKKLFTAINGQGAFLNRKKIEVSKIDSLIDSLIVTGFPYNDPALEKKVVSGITALRGNCQGIRRFGSAALDLCYVAQGVVDGFFEYSLYPWDVAAGILIVREAGGRVTDINGNEAKVGSGHYLASNSLLHKNILSLIFG
ncbi:inositol monophosphatase [archaeon]|nr:inositol monophosphatase [archaeon]